MFIIKIAHSLIFTCLMATILASSVLSSNQHCEKTQVAIFFILTCVISVVGILILMIVNILPYDDANRCVATQTACHVIGANVLLFALGLQTATSEACSKPFKEYMTAGVLYSTITILLSFNFVVQAAINGVDLKSLNTQS